MLLEVFNFGGNGLLRAEMQIPYASASSANIKTCLEILKNKF